MVVPALDTSFIGTFAYLQPATSVQLADLLPYMISYQQYTEYLDGVIRVYDTGTSGHYCDAYIRVRTDGWMMAFFPDDSHAGSTCWGDYDWTINYENRGDLIWWNHAHTTVGNPTTDSTRLAKALSLMWARLKANSDDPTYEFAWTDVDYWDYEHTNSAKIYIFGAHVYKRKGLLTQTFTFVFPGGTTSQCIYANYGYYVKGFVTQCGTVKSIINEGTEKALTLFYAQSCSHLSPKSSAGFETANLWNYHFLHGQENHVLVYCHGTYDSDVTYEYNNTALIIFASA